MPYLPSTVRNVTLGPNGDTVIIHRTKPLNEHTTAELCDQLLFMAAYNGLLNGLTQHLTVQQQLDYDRQTEEIKALILERVQMGELGAPTTVVTPLIFPEMHRIAAEALARPPRLQDMPVAALDGPVRPTPTPGYIAVRVAIRNRILNLLRGARTRDRNREIRRLRDEDMDLQSRFIIRAREADLANATTDGERAALRAEIEGYRRLLLE